jgi:hypothetical protein
MKFNILKISGYFLAFFGLVSLFMTTSVIFDLFGIREKEGNYVLFVVISNFIASILYLSASYGMFKKLNWTAIPLFLSVFILITAYLFLQVLIENGGVYEEKTVKALIIRIVLSLIIAVIAYLKINKKSNTYEK